HVDTFLTSDHRPRLRISTVRDTTPMSGPGAYDPDAVARSFVCRRGQLPPEPRRPMEHTYQRPYASRAERASGVPSPNRHESCADHVHRKCVWEGVVLERINSLEDRYWGSHSRLFENVTHVIGGVGIGLLAASKDRASNRRFGRIFL